MNFQNQHNVYRILFVESVKGKIHLCYNHNNEYKEIWGIPVKNEQ